jgi:16S rRNA (cytosine967-C5)-methyltransferase
MKLHRPTAEAVVQALQLIFEENKYADKVIEKILKQNPKWGARDRRFIAETTYDIVRWYRLLQESAKATDHDYWTILGAYFTLRGVQLPGWEMFKPIDHKEIVEKRNDLENIRKIRQSIPDWLDDLGEKELGNRWDQELEVLNKEAAVVLRVNTLKTNLGKLQQQLREDSVETTTIDRTPDALIVAERQNVFRLKAFQDGQFEMQDAASQRVAPFLNVEPGMRVIDACAGAGGKTLHLAALMKNKGRLIALDVDQSKLTEMQKRARRAGISNLEIRLIDSFKVIKRLAGTADRLLLDVPCSGLGVLRRNPDAKWKLSEQFINEVRTLQLKILNDYCTMIKPGGLLVYATCSILPSENEEQVKTFLTDRQNTFELIAQKRCWPSEGFDGFYMALLKRKS